MSLYTHTEVWIIENWDCTTETENCGKRHWKHTEVITRISFDNNSSNMQLKY